LLAQGVGGFRAAAAGAFINGAAGDLAEEQFGYHLTPTDLLDLIPKIMDDPMCHRTILEKRLR
jgi:NAD(P)H-hydrate repair Nnr-like enzyme with NAD(P)H-hydrate dehydratase domain